MAAAYPDHDPSPPRWQQLGDSLRCVLYWPHLSRTGLTALIVGTILFAINQLDVVLAGHATTTTWIKIVVTYLVPFWVSNIGLLIGAANTPPRPLGSAGTQGGERSGKD